MDYALARNAVVTVEDPEPDYIDGDRAAGLTGSFPPAKFFNQLQREVLNVIEGAELVPSDANLSQLYEAILALIAEHSGGGGGGGGPYVPTTRALMAGAGLSGGGTLAADRTFNLDLSDLTAITELQAADMFGVYDNSATATRKISWETLLGLIADALDGGGGGVPAADGVGSMIITNGPGSGTFGTIVAGSTLNPPRPGTWRVQSTHAFWSVPSGDVWSTTVGLALYVRIS
jgi:hypothetical protein